MRYRELGGTGLVVSELGIGCSRLGGLFSPDSSRAEELALLGAAVDAGITFFDTADMYSQGQSEVLVGKAFRSKRAEVVIATKGGYVAPPHSRFLARAKPMVRPLVRGLRLRRPTTSFAGTSGSARPAQDFSPAYLTSAVEASLRRLSTDYIDIFQLHSPPRAVVERGEFVAALVRLKEQGKIRHIGIAADHADDVAGLPRHPALTAVQVPFSAMHQEASRRVFPAAAEAGVGVISRSCFGAGLLVGSTPDDVLRQQTPDWAAIVAFRQTAEQVGRPVKELALQFNLAIAPIAVTILGMRTRAHLRENLALAAASPLTEDELAALVVHPD